jgi:methionine-rich copper-binding protein CopC
MAPRLVICRKPWTKVNKRRDVPLLLALLLALLLVGTADAHANLVRAEPPPAAALAAAPSELVLEFSEELDPGFSKIQLLDSKSQVIDPGPGLVDPPQPTILRLSVAELPKGAYTALWRVRSQVDGHVTEGNLPFGRRRCRRRR